MSYHLTSLCPPPLVVSSRDRRIQKNKSIVIMQHHLRLFFKHKKGLNDDAYWEPLREIIWHGIPYLVKGFINFQMRVKVIGSSNLVNFPKNLSRSQHFQYIQFSNSKRSTLIFIDLIDRVILVFLVCSFMKSQQISHVDIYFLCLMTYLAKKKSRIFEASSAPIDTLCVYHTAGWWNENFITFEYETILGRHLISHREMWV